MTFPKPLDDLDQFVVDVTQADINNGEVGECSSCPIALAVLRSLASYYLDAVSVTSQISVYDSNKVHSFRYPDRAYRFISAFDTHQPVEPFSFTAVRY